jgi:phosphoglycerate dehydrogenase-like enzyme
MINEAFLQQCRPDVVLINTSRGDIVNEEELLAGLEARPNLWYACDVHTGEPTTNDVDFTCRLAQHPRVYGT